MNSFLDTMNPNMEPQQQQKQQQQPPVDLLSLDNNNNNLYNGNSSPLVKSTHDSELVMSPYMPPNSSSQSNSAYPTSWAYSPQQSPSIYPPSSAASSSPSPTYSTPHTNQQQQQPQQQQQFTPSSPTPSVAQAPPSYKTSYPTPVSQSPYQAPTPSASQGVAATYAPPASTPVTVNNNATTQYSPKLNSYSPQVSVQQTQPQNNALVQMIEKLQSNFDVVIQRIEGVENRLASLEIVTKEILNTQRGMQVQQKKLQDAVETKEKTPAFEEPPKKPVMVTTYPPPVPTVTSTMPSYYSTPPPMNYNPQPSLVAVSHMNQPVDTCKADAELAKRLQAEFDQEQSKPQPKPTSAPTPKPQPQVQTQTQECPLCQTRVPTADLEAHVEQHFEDDEAVRTSKGATKAAPDPKKETSSKGFFGKLFSKDEEKKPEPAATPSSTKSDSQPSTNNSSGNNSTSNNSSNTNSSTHSSSNSQSATPTPVVAYPPYMAPRGYYPGMVQGQFRTPQGYYPTAAYQQRMGNQMQQQQYLYYPSLEQQPPQ